MSDLNPARRVFPPARGGPPTPGTLRATPTAEGRRISIRVDASAEAQLGISFELPFSAATVTDEHLSLLTVAAALAFAALLPAAEISISGPPAPSVAARAALDALVRMAVDARCLAASEMLRPSSPLRFVAPSARPQLVAAGARAGVVLCLSGGLDSALAALRVRDAGLPARLLHVAGLNLDAEGEEAAATRIARRLGLELDIVRVQWTGLRESGRRFAAGIFGAWPRLNTVPFGRDLLLVALGLAFAGRHGARHVCLAHEFDVWRREPTPYLGRSVFRTELATETAGLHLDTVVRAISAGRHRYGSPIGGWTKYRLFDELTRRGPELFLELSFCYWGRWCGRCPKCATYGLLAAERGLPLPFEHDPLTALAEAPGAWSSSAKGPMVGSAVREPLGMASLVALDALLERGALPRGPSFEQYRAAHRWIIGDRAPAMRSALLMPRDVRLDPTR